MTGRGAGWDCWGLEPRWIELTQCPRKEWSLRDSKTEIQILVFGGNEFGDNPEVYLSVKNYNRTLAYALILFGERVETHPDFFVLYHFLGVPVSLTLMCACVDVCTYLCSLEGKETKL
jgi:hypothetical protein